MDEMTTDERIHLLEQQIRLLTRRVDNLVQNQATLASNIHVPFHRMEVEKDENGAFVARGFRLIPDVSADDAPSTPADG